MIMTAKRAALLAVSAPIAILAAAPAWAQTSPAIAPATTPLNDTDCNFYISQETTVPPCEVDGTRSVTYVNRTRTVRNATTDLLTDTYTVNFSGNLKVDGLPLRTSTSYTFPYSAPNTPSSGIDVSGLLDTTGQVVNVTSAYTGYNQQIVSTGASGSAAVTNPAYFSQVGNISTTVNSIGIDIDSYFETGDGNEYDYVLKSIDPTNIVNNGTAVTGHFKSDDDADALIFGKLAGTATVTASPGYTYLPFDPDTGAVNTGTISLYALGYDVTATVTTQLDHNGLITPTVAVTDGIAMNGSKISGLAAGTEASDAVNLAQLQAAVAGAGGTGSSYVKINSTGPLPTASGADAIAIGNGASASAANALALGANAVSGGTNTTAVGAGAVSNGFQTVAVGAGAKSSAFKGVVVGNDASAGSQGVAVGDAANAQGVRSTVVGESSTANGADALVFGSNTLASGDGSMGVGARTEASGLNTTAVGYGAKAKAERASAFGTEASATGVNALAMGYQASAAFQNAVAIGYAAQATRANQMMFGTITNTYTMPGLARAASNAAQSGNTYYVTVDANGNLGYVSTPITASSGQTTLAVAPTQMAISSDPMPVGAPEGVLVATLGADQNFPEPVADAAPGSSRSAVRASSTVVARALAAPAIAAVTDTQFSALSGRVSTLEGKVDALAFNLSELDKRSSGGIAAAMAMGGPAIAPGKNVSLAMSVANYRGQQAIAGSLTGQIVRDVYLSAGVSGNTADGDIGTRATVLFGF